MTPSRNALALLMVSLAGGLLGVGFVGGGGDAAAQTARHDSGRRAMFAPFGSQRAPIAQVGFGRERRRGRTSSHYNASRFQDHPSADAAEDDPHSPRPEFLLIWSNETRQGIEAFRARIERMCDWRSQTFIAQAATAAGNWRELETLALPPLASVADAWKSESTPNRAYWTACDCPAVYQRLGLREPLAISTPSGWLLSGLARRVLAPAPRVPLQVWYAPPRAVEAVADACHPSAVPNGQHMAVQNSNLLEALADGRHGMGGAVANMLNAENDGLTLVERRSEASHQPLSAARWTARMMRDAARAGAITVAKWHHWGDERTVAPLLQMAYRAQERLSPALNDARLWLASMNRGQSRQVAVQGTNAVVVAAQARVAGRVPTPAPPAGPFTALRQGWTNVCAAGYRFCTAAGNDLRQWFERSLAAAPQVNSDDSAQAPRGSRSAAAPPVAKS